MNSELIKPSVLNSSISTRKMKDCIGNDIYDWHMHEECEFILATDNNYTFTVNNREYILEKDDIFFINERIPHKIKSSPGDGGYLLQAKMDYNTNEINKYLYRYLSQQSCDAAIFRHGTELCASLRKCYDEINSEYKNKQVSYDMFIKASVMKIFAILYRNDVLKDIYSNCNEKSLKRILPVIEYINVHYKEHLSLEDMSRLINVDKAHFCRLFKKAVNTTFVQYLNFVRICKAEKLLLSSDKQIYEIAMETGFSSLAYFTETFRTMQGCTPSQYKRIKLRD